MTLTVTDLFCGAGGSSIGAEAAGATLRMAANHWDLAVETHNRAFPDADHDCADISQVDPRRYPTTDILLASPECTTHSLARSNKHRTDLFNPEGDPAVERSRATMWDVPRFAEAMANRGQPYQAIVVENVVEIMRWLPIDGWFLAMEKLGYRWRLVSANSMIAWPTPQSRDRWYCVFWRAGNREPDLDLRPESWCAKCERTVEGRQAWKQGRIFGKYRQQYVYRCGTCNTEVAPLVYPAAAAIDWTLPAPRIGDRARPLAPATRRRIEIGLERFGSALIQAAGHTYERAPYVRAWPVDSRPMPAQTGTLQHGVAVPAMVVSTTHTHGNDQRAPRSVDEPIATQTARLEHGLVVPLRRHGLATDAERSPLPTVAAEGNHHALVVRNHGGVDQAGSMARPADEPFGALTGAGNQAIVPLPFTVTYYRTGQPSPVDEPIPTVTCVDRHGLVEPSVVVDDCGFRMLEPHEIGAAMAFPETYQVLGSKRQRVRMYGNAVTPPVMRQLVGRIVESLS